MRLLLLVAVVISACSHAVSWSLHHGALDNDILADRGIPTIPSTQALSLHRLLSAPDIYRTLPELAHLYSDNDESEVEDGAGLSDWRYSPHRVDPATDTEPWSRTDIGSDPEVQTGEQSLCRDCDSSADYDSSSSTSLVPSPPDENDDMKPVIRPSQIKRKTTSRSNQHGSRFKREAVAMETEQEVQKKDPSFNSWGGKRAPAFNSWGGKRNPAFSVLGTVRRRAFTSTGSRRSPAFNSWGGKRSYSFSLMGDGTHPFSNSWGGKSNPTLSTSTSEETPAFTVLGKRQSSFHSWGGKRDPRFSSWGGKRDPSFSILGDYHEPAFKIIGGGITEPSYNIVTDKTEPAFKILGNHDFPSFSVLNDKYEPAFSVLNEKRSPGFSSWGGKRDPAFNSWGGKRDPAFNSWGGKRDPGFSSWGGKRSSGFSSWGGKRDAAFSSWGGKRNEDSLDLPKRNPKFSSWGGKRDMDEEEKRSFSSWGGKRDPSDSPKRSFSSWGGKRAAATQTEGVNIHHNNSVGSKEVADGEVQSNQHKERENGVENDKEEPTEELIESDKEEEDGRRHIGTQTSFDFQKLLEEFGDKMQLEEGEQKSEIKEDGKEDEGEGAAEDKAEISEKADINMRQEVIGMEDKSVGTTNTEEKGVGTSDSLTINKRDTARTGTRVSKAMFNPWGGKRSQQTPSLFTVLASMSRGIGRSDGFLSDLLYKRGSSRHSSLGSKKWGQASAGAVFSSWGGKRSEKESNLRKASPQNMGRQYRRGADFYSWGGKR